MHSISPCISFPHFITHMHRAQNLEPARIEQDSSCRRKVLVLGHHVKPSQAPLWHNQQHVYSEHVRCTPHRNHLIEDSFFFLKSPTSSRSSSCANVKKSVSANYSRMAWWKRHWSHEYVKTWPVSILASASSYEEWLASCPVHVRSTWLGRHPKPRNTQQDFNRCAGAS